MRVWCTLMGRMGEYKPERLEVDDFLFVPLPPSIHRCIAAVSALPLTQSKLSQQKALTGALLTSFPLTFYVAKPPQHSSSGFIPQHVHTQRESSPSAGALRGQHPGRTPA